MGYRPRELAEQAVKSLNEPAAEPGSYDDTVGKSLAAIADALTARHIVAVIPYDQPADDDLALQPGENVGRILGFVVYSDRTAGVLTAYASGGLIIEDVGVETKRFRRYRRLLELIDQASRVIWQKSGKEILNANKLAHWILADETAMRMVFGGGMQPTPHAVDDIVEWATELGAAK